MDKLDVYRISDPIFRVHARLFRLQEAILRSSAQQIRAAKQTVVAQAAGSSALFTFLLTLVVEVFKIEWNSTPVIVIALVGVTAILIHLLEIVNLRKDERDFDRLLAEAGGAGVESWVDYSESLIAGYGTRFKMINEAIAETEKLRQDGALGDPLAQERLEYLSQISNFCVGELERYRARNEALFKDGKRRREDYESIKRFIAIAHPEPPPAQKAHA